MARSPPTCYTRRVFSPRLRKRCVQSNVCRHALRVRMRQRTDGKVQALPLIKSCDSVQEFQPSCKDTEQAYKLPWKPKTFTGGCVLGLMMPPRIAWVLVGVVACALAGHFGKATQNFSASFGLGMSLSLCATSILRPYDVTNTDFAAMSAVIVLLVIARSAVQTILMKGDLESREASLDKKQTEFYRHARNVERRAQDRAQEYASEVVKQARRRAKNAEGVAKGLRARFHEDSNDVCKICFERPSSCALLPCKHLGFCRVCAEYIAGCPESKCRCPICRTPVISIFQGYPA